MILLHCLLLWFTVIKQPFLSIFSLLIVLQYLIKVIVSKPFD